MKVLVTAGSTQTMVDKVRCLTNIFAGKTGTNIAFYMYWENNCEVTLLTSNSGLAETYRKEYSSLRSEISGLDLRRAPKVIRYKTFAQLAELMEKEIKTGDYDLVIHSAAVNDYQVEGVYVKENDELTRVESSTKVPSTHTELFMRMTPTFKIVDKIRNEWGFRGKLVKFKLQVGMSDEELIQIAKKSCATSEADIIVANCLEWATDYAYVIDKSGEVVKVSRSNLPMELSRRLL